MLDADDGVRAATTTTAAAALLHPADEVVAHARKVARACADVEHARAGTVAQIREEELGCVRVLCFLRWWCGGVVALGASGLGATEENGRFYVPCGGQRWLRRGRSIFTVTMRYSISRKNENKIRGLLGCEGHALGRVFVCMSLVEDVIRAVDGIHRLERAWKS